MRATKTIIEDQTTPACILFIIAVRALGTECFEWVPGITRYELESDYAVSMSDFQSHKLQCAISLVSGNDYESEWHIFEIFNHLLSNEPTMMDSVDPLTPEELAMGLAHASVLLDGESDRLIFGAEVRAYVGQILWDYGFYKAPTIFPTAIMPDTNMPDEDRGRNEEIWKDKDRALSDIYSGVRAKLIDSIKDLDELEPPSK